MYWDIINYSCSCAKCTIVTGSGRKKLPPLQSIPVDRAFQIVGLDIVALSTVPLTARGNRYANVNIFQDMFTKWPTVYATPDQKNQRISKLLTQEIVQIFRVPEALITDRETNLLSCCKQDVSRLLGIKKISATTHHPQCNGVLERFYRTMKTMLRKNVSKFGEQWGTYFSGVLWAY